MRVPRIVLVVAIVAATAISASAQVIVIRTGENIDRVLGTPLVEGKLTFALPSGEKITIPVEYVETALTRAVISATSSATTLSTSPTSTPALQVSGNAINELCEAEWKDDFKMQAYCRQQQTEARATVMKRDMSSGDRLVIRQRCLREWGNNYRMLNYCEEQQLKALQSLGR